jgi:hypothetical protein
MQMSVLAKLSPARNYQIFGKGKLFQKLLYLNRLTNDCIAHDDPDFSAYIQVASMTEKDTVNEN